MHVLGFSGLNNSVSFKRREFPDLEPRAYRIAQGFDAAAAVVSDTGVHAAAAEERFTREKTTNAFPINAIRYCLQAAAVQVEDLDAIAHNFDYAPYKSLFDESDYTQRQYREVYSEQAQVDLIREHFPGTGLEERLVRVPHHLAHAASTFYLSGMDEALIVVSDGMGEQHSTTVAVGQGSDIEVLTRVPSIHSLGILYSVFTLYLGFVFNMDEYKIMGLAPYGDPRKYADKMQSLVNLKDDGTHSISILFRNETDLAKETYGQTIEALTELFGPPRDPEAELSQHHMDIAAALQSTLEIALQHLLKTYRDQTGQKNLCTAGGVSLNCTANGVIQRSRMFQRMFVQPASGDDGSALGAALYVQRQRNPSLDTRRPTNARMGLPLWGPEFSPEEITAAVETADAVEATYYGEQQDLVDAAADRLADGQIIGWFHGRMEFGPRALGSRSILADPRRADMRDRVNALVKKRESFRPFAPAVARESATEYFHIPRQATDEYAHMLFVTPVRRQHREALPAITHVDGTARAQTVDQDNHPRFWALLKALEARTGMPVVLNTSFNVRGQPIVCTPEEAIETFRVAQLNALVIGNYILVDKNRS